MPSDKATATFLDTLFRGLHHHLTPDDPGPIRLSTTQEAMYAFRLTSGLTWEELSFRTGEPGIKRTEIVGTPWHIPLVERLRSISQELNLPRFEQFFRDQVALMRTGRQRQKGRPRFGDNGKSGEEYGGVL